MPQLDTAYHLSSVFWLACSFGLLFLFVQFWLVPRIASVLQQRVKVFEGKLARVSALREEVGRLQAKQDAALSSLKEEAGQLRLDCLSELEREEEAALKALEERYARIGALETEKLNKAMATFAAQIDSFAEPLARAIAQKARLTEEGQ